MNLIGWNVLPDDCVVELKFEGGPSWLKILALTPYFERFAYPTAVKRGLGILWCGTLNPVEREALVSSGWILETREKTEEEKFLEGSLAILTPEIRPHYRPRIALTRWGRQRSTRNFVHKSNGTYSHSKNGTLPSGL